MAFEFSLGIVTKTADAKERFLSLQPLVPGVLLRAYTDVDPATLKRDRIDGVVLNMSQTENSEIELALQSVTYVLGYGGYRHYLDRISWALPDLENVPLEEFLPDFTDAVDLLGGRKAREMLKYQTGNNRDTRPRLKKDLTVDCYQLMKRLGGGFSADVWQAKVVSTSDGVGLTVGTEVAIKFYNLEILSKLGESIRIQREFRIASELDHPGIVKVFDLVLSPSRPFQSFMVMELVEGETLKQLISGNPDGLDFESVLDYGMQLFGAIEVLHAEGAVHRDVKPANIVVTSTDSGRRLVLLDLGIVSVPDTESLNPTSPSAFLGSKQYAPLEQLIGGQTDERSDIYSVAATLFHCYRGFAMYHNKGPAPAISIAMQSPEFIPVSPEASDREKRFVRLINSCLATNPGERPQSARDILAILETL